MNQNTWWLMITSAILVGGGVHRRLNPHLAEMPERRQSSDRKQTNVNVPNHLNTPLKVLVPKEMYGGTEEEVVKFIARLTQFASAQSAVRFVWKIERTTNRDKEYRFFLGVPNNAVEGVMRNLPEGMEAHDTPVKWKTSMNVNYRMVNVGLREVLLPIRSGFGKSDPLFALLRSLPQPSEIVITFSPLDKKAVMSDLQKLHKKLDPNLRVTGQSEGGRDTNTAVWVDRMDRVGHIAGVAGRGFLGILAETTGVKEIEKLGQFNEQRKPPSQRTPKITNPKLLPHEEARLKAIKARYADAGAMFDCTLQLVVPAGDASQGDIQGLMGALIDFRGENEFVLKKGEESFWLSASELAGLVHVPGVKQCPTQLWIRDHSFTLRDDEFTHGVAVGEYQHPTQDGRQIFIPSDQFTKHFLLSGTTGAGKSTFFNYINNSLVDNWLAGWKNGKWTPQPGFTLIDPAENAVLYILARLQYELEPDHPLWSKVHYLSFAEDAHPFALNAMQFLKPDEVLDLLHTEYGGGANLDRLLRMGINTLFADAGVSHVIAGLSALFTIPVFRKKVLARLDDMELEVFWKEEFPEISAGSIRPVLNRLNPFTDRSSILRPYYGQPDFSLPIREWMDDGHIILIDAKDAKTDTAVEYLLGTLVSGYHWIYQTRKQEVSLLHFLEVDEAHKIRLPVMANIIKEDRKFGGCLGVITQMVNDLEAETSIKIQEMAGTIISLQQGPKEVNAVVNMTNGHFNANYLKGLPERVAAVFLRVGTGGTSLEVAAPYPRLFSGYQDDREPAFKSSTMSKRLDEMRELGRKLQSDIGVERQQIESNLQHYLLNAEWPT